MEGLNEEEFKKTLEYTRPDGTKRRDSIEQIVNVVECVGFNGFKVVNQFLESGGSYGDSDDLGLGSIGDFDVSHADRC